MTTCTTSVVYVKV